MPKYIGFITDFVHRWFEFIEDKARATLQDSLADYKQKILPRNGLLCADNMLRRVCGRLMRACSGVH